MKEHEPKKKRTSLVFLFFLLLSLAALCFMSAAGFIKVLSSSTGFYVVLGLLSAGILSLLIRRLVLGPQKQPGWTLADTVSNKRKIRLHGFMGYLGGLLLLLGILAVLTAANWRRLFSLEKSITITEGEVAALPFTASDSVHLYKFGLSFYPGSQPPSILNHNALVEDLINGVHSWDTIRLNDPLRRGEKRIYITNYGVSKDSLYLLCDLLLPWGDTISYEFPPEGVIDDPLFPLIVSFEKFHIDRTSLWPNPEVPVVTVNLMLPGKLLASRRMRAPDSISAEGYTLFFKGVRMRPTVTFLCVNDQSWIVAAAGTLLIILGLTAGFVSRAKKLFGVKDV